MFPAAELSKQADGRGGNMLRMPAARQAGVSAKFSRAECRFMKPILGKRIVIALHI
jgi:hypothetical protein